MFYYTNVAAVGNNILFRGIKDGKRVSQKHAYKPTLFVKGKQDSISKWKNLEGEVLEPFKFGSLYEAREFEKKYAEVDNFKIYGQSSYQYAFISEFFGTKVKFDPDDIVIATIDIEVASDNGFPKPETAFSEITAITLHVKNRFIKETEGSGLFYAFGTKPYVPSRTDVVYKQCEDERDLILSFIQVWKLHYPDIVTGWSIETFDFPYIINRMTRLFMEDDLKKLSPWGKVSERVKYQKGSGKEIQTYEMVGISIIDYHDLYKKHSKNPSQENYKLKHIAFVEIGETKVDFTGSLYDLYVNNFKMFMDYNIQDVALIPKMNEKLRLLELVMVLAYNNKVNFVDVFSQVRMWDAITYNALYNKNIIVPPKGKNSKNKEFEGAYVKEPKPGRYGWVVSFDLDGLYPHLKMMFNMSPETIVDSASLGDEFYTWFKALRVNVESLLDMSLDLDMLKKYNVCMTPNKQLFKRDKQGFVPEILESMYEDRKKYKNKMIAAEKQILSANAENISDLEKEVAMCNNFQSAMKVNLNSEYGASGSPYYRFFDLRIAEAVTTSGQLAIRWIQQEMNIFLNKLIGTTDVDFIIASDTDSMYIDFSKLIESILPDHDKMSTIEVIREMDKICNNTIQPFIKKAYKKLDAYVNSFASKMNMKRESLCDAAIWTAKKHYMLSVWNNEGVEYDKPKLKIVGLEAVMTGSLSIDARVKIKKAYEYIIYNNLPGLRKFTEEYKREFNKLSVEEISIPKTCNGLSKYHDNQKIWGFKTPFHVKGALLYNHILKEKKLDKKYPEIKEGEKVRYLYIKEPNYYHTEALAFPEKLPEEFDLHPFIDYNMMFQKTYIDPVETILDAIGWKLKETRSLESLWS